MSIEALCTAALHSDSDGNDEKDIQREEMSLHRCGFIL